MTAIAGEFSVQVGQNSSSALFSQTLRMAVSGVVVAEVSVSERSIEDRESRLAINRDNRLN